ncbi:MAG: helix-hairpin-helix domain-containing protein, partial [Pyrinomonadaceae bacterium]
SIKNTERLPLWRFLAALGIDHVGATIARTIADAFGTPAKLRSASIQDLIAIDGVGDIVAKSLHSWIHDKAHAKLLDALLSHITIERPKSTGGALTGKSFVFTGTLEGYSRDEAGELVRAKGGTVSSSISANTDYLVVGGEPGSKAKKAEALGVTVLTESQFERLIGR